MPIPADISEQRSRFTRDHSAVSRQYRERNKMDAAEPEPEPEPKAAKKTKRSKKSDEE